MVKLAVRRSRQLKDHAAGMSEILHLNCGPKNL
jgi:hypothetical protein